MCIGEQFAWSEAATMLAELGRTWRVRVHAAPLTAGRSSMTLAAEGSRTGDGDTATGSLTSSGSSCDTAESDKTGSFVSWSDYSPSVRKPSVGIHRGARLRRERTGAGRLRKDSDRHRVASGRPEWHRNRNGPRAPECPRANVAEAELATPTAEPPTDPAPRPAGPDCAKLKCIALTYDDGPFPDQAAALATTLRQYKVKATFFMLGQNAENYPDAVKAIAATGSEVANHSWSHANLSRLG